MLRGLLWLLIVANILLVVLHLNGLIVANWIWFVVMNVAIVILSYAVLGMAIHITDIRIDMQNKRRREEGRY